MKRKKYFLKRLIRAFMALFMSLFIVIGSAFTSYNKAYGAEVLPVVAKIAQYILSSVGAVNIATNGGVSRVSGNLYDGLVQRVSDAMGNGVYVDSSGNYVFSNEFSNNVLSYLQGNSDIQYRVLSDFNTPAGFNGIWENSQYVNSLFLERFQTGKSRFSNYLISEFFDPTYNSKGPMSSIVFYDISNVAFIANNRGTFSFYDKNSSIISVPTYSFSCFFYRNRYYDSSIDTSNNSYIALRGIYYDGVNHSYSSPSISDVNSFFMSLPSSITNGDDTLHLYSNRSIIVSLSVAGANSVINKQSGTFISNYNIPSIKQNVVEDNDWENIYNNYVTNVSNSYTENNTSGNFDQTLLRKWMKNYSDNIITAIQNGDTNIAEQINYLNEWMKKIYERLGMIYSLIENQNNVNSGGSASFESPWTKEDINDILSGLNRLETNMSYQLDEMENIYTVLTNFYNWAIAHPPSSGGGGGTPNVNDDPYTPWTDIIKNMPDTDFNDIITKWDVIKTLLEDIAPFAMLGIVTASLNAFSAEPQDPIFTIPLKMHNDYIDIDENVVIDFTVLEDLRTIVNALVMILATVCYAMFCWWLIPKLYEIIV